MQPNGPSLLSEVDSETFHNKDSCTEKRWMTTHRKHSKRQPRDINNKTTGAHLPAGAREVA
jgi:hypothetical protein